MRKNRRIIRRFIEIFIQKFDDKIIFDWGSQTHKFFKLLFIIGLFVITHLIKIYVKIQRSLIFSMKKLPFFSSIRIDILSKKISDTSIQTLRLLLVDWTSLSQWRRWYGDDNLLFVYTNIFGERTFYFYYSFLRYPLRHLSPAMVTQRIIDKLK